MRQNDLNSPLQAKAPRRSRVVPILATALVAAAVSVAVLAAVWIAIVDDPYGGQPVAVAMIDDAPEATGSIPAKYKTRSGDAEAVGGLVPPEAGVELAQLPSVLPIPSAGSADPGLLEQSASGPLPRIAPDGRRPRDAYARRSPAANADVPRIALVIGGMGLSQTGTSKAIDSLPEDVTLAFAPYGASLQRWVDKARGEGHEVVLQIPLEPAGYPDENPGEHTLLVSNDRHATHDDLRWVLSRMTAYAGVMNYMGARFTREDGALMPFLGEIGERGLYYLDDGSSADSRAKSIGETLNVPVVVADLIIDRDRTPAAIEHELAALEAIARSRGVAVGAGSAFPDTIQTVAAWAKSARERGVVLVPASAAVQR